MMKISVEQFNKFNVFSLNDMTDDLQEDPLSDDNSRLECTSDNSNTDEQQQVSTHDTSVNLHLKMN